MQTIAHRGASGYAPENTVAAFDLALEMAASGIETDVQVTRDGELVLFHDNLVDRTTNGCGPLADHTVEELKQLDAGSWFAPEFAGQRIPTLAEFADAFFDRIPTCVEVKDPLAVEPLVSFLRDRSDLSRVQITSFSWSALLRVRAALDVGTGFLCRTFNRDIIDRCLGRGIDQICPPVVGLDAELVEVAHDHGLTVRAWGVKSRDDVSRVVNSGADGATCNWPDWMIEHP